MKGQLAVHYVADTVALVRHLRKHRRLGKQARGILREADAGKHTVYISAVTLMEILYLSEAQRIDVKLPEVIALISGSSNYVIVPIDANIVLAAAGVDDVPELHDRILVGTAKYLQAPLLSGDPILAKSKHVQTIWIDSSHNFFDHARCASVRFAPEVLLQ